MTCSACNRDKEIKARGLCGACYGRWQKSGSTEYRRRRSVCSVGNCGKPAVSGGLCDTHRKRLERHGHTQETRPDCWGAKTKHPLYHSWAYMRRFRGKHLIAPEWSDFLQFAIDVGERPSRKHKIFAADEKKPIGPRNFVWKRAITEKAEGEDPATYSARAQKVYRKLRPNEFKGYDLKRYFGISAEEYQEMHNAQGGLCMICRKPETAVIRGKLAALAVDHCHTKGRVRGLLCSQCNTGLGCFKDDPAALRRAAEYIEWPERLL